ncbi:AcrR family transcriptional regulator [Nocardia transvalensis]|uniref:AcrR family transcriptional regulator n=1 Tax=Nocardia transvalensis TaxID=37333 RepID=A0A7W9UG84_9NOCA|nr:TetR/AcrR family transcriptional regulator [Nocardia transvalensis]MBB5911806.1 AcrR family transcriptional regulator [Nocardia transvalensis]
MVDVIEPGRDGAPPRPRRRDARDNRERIAAAAKDRFTREGLEASLNAIAREAGVSIGTLYNHFPTREALINETMLDCVERSVVLAENALRAPDPWTGLVDHLTMLAEWQAADRGFTDICVYSLPAESPVEQAKHRGHTLFQQLIARARESGALRADVDVPDIGLMLWAVVRATEGIRAAAPDAWRRHLAILLDGLRADAARPLPGAPLPAELLRTAMTIGR